MAETRDDPGPRLLISLSDIGLVVGLVRALADNQDRRIDLLVDPSTDRHSEKMFPLIERLLASCGTPVAALTALVVDAGPGGFTRVRVAVAAAQGMAAGLAVPMCCVDSLQALALAGARESAPGTGALVSVLIDARMKECYAARFAVRVADPVPVTVIQASQTLAMKDAAVWLATAPPDGKPVDDLATLNLIEPRLVISANPVGAASPSQWPSVSGLLEAMADLAGTALAPFVPAREAQPNYVRHKVALNLSEQAGLRSGSEQAGLRSVGS